MILTTNKKWKYMKKTTFVFGFTCKIKETNNANVLVTRIDDYAKLERVLTLS